MAEVAVGLVDDDDTLELVDDLQHLLAVDGVARGVVGRAYPDELRVVVGSSQQLLGRNLELFVEQHRTVLHVVDVGTDLVHTVGGLDGNDIVAAGLTEDAVGQVDGLVATVAEEDVLLANALHLSQGCLQLELQGVGVAVVRLVVWVLVGIEEYTCLTAGILVTGRAIGCERPDIWTNQLL